MIKKIRRNYYRNRDRGKGKQFVLKVILASISVFLLTLCLSWEIAKPFLHSSDEVVAEETTEEVDVEKNDTLDVDVSELEAYLSFMAEDAYEKLIEDVRKHCEKRKCDKVTTLEYQDVGETEDDVVTYMELSDETIYSCTYHLTTGKYTLKEETLLTKAQLQRKVEAIQAEEALALQETQSPVELVTELASTPTATPTATPKTTATPVPTVAPSPKPVVAKEKTDKTSSKKKKKKTSKKQTAKKQENKATTSSPKTTTSTDRKGSAENDTAVTSSTATIR